MAGGIYVGEVGGREDRVSFVRFVTYQNERKLYYRCCSCVGVMNICVGVSDFSVLNQKCFQQIFWNLSPPLIYLLCFLKKKVKKVSTPNK